MFNFITNNKYNAKLKDYPIITKHPKMSDLIELRKKIGCGVYSCKLLLQRCYTVQEAIDLHYKIAMEINNL